MSLMGLERGLNKISICFFSSVQISSVAQSCPTLCVATTYWALTISRHPVKCFKHIVSFNSPCPKCSEQILSCTFYRRGDWGQGYAAGKQQSQEWTEAWLTLKLGSFILDSECKHFFLPPFLLPWSQPSSTSTKIIAYMFINTVNLHSCLLKVYF